MSSPYTNPAERPDTLSESSELVPVSKRFKFIEAEAATLTKLATSELRCASLVTDNLICRILQSPDETHGIILISVLRVDVPGQLHLRGSAPNDGILYSITVESGSVVATALDDPAPDDLDPPA
jgi:hypothetical protein